MPFLADNQFGLTEIFGELRVSMAVNESLCSACI